MDMQTASSAVERLSGMLADELNTPAPSIVYIRDIAAALYSYAHLDAWTLFPERSAYALGFMAGVDAADSGYECPTLSGEWAGTITDIGIYRAVGCMPGSDDGFIPGEWVRGAADAYGQLS